MFGFIARRILAAVPALLTFTFALFLAMSLAPPPGLAGDEAERRFWYLPLVFNLSPEDRPLYVRRLVDEVAETTGERRDRSLRRLLRVGAAGLPDLVAAMARRDAGTRARLARALAPLAARMGLEDTKALDDDARASDYFRRVLEERETDLHASSVRRTLSRHLADRTEPLYARKLRDADTAVLAPVFDELTTARDERREALEAIALAALVRAGTRVRDADALYAWWAVHRGEYVQFGALERIAARLTETRFGRWTIQSVTGRFGRSFRTGEPVLQDLAARAPLTLARVGFGLLLAWLFAVPLSLLTAARRGSLLDRVTSALLLLLHAVPPFALAIVARAASPRLSRTDAFVALAIAAVTVSPLTRFSRARLREELGSDWVRTSRAMGLPPFVIWTRDVARNALGAIVALAALAVPTIFAATLLIEEILEIGGLGPAVVAAVRARDIPWLMAFGLFSAASGACALVAADVLQAWTDPRVRRSLLAGPEEP